MHSYYKAISSCVAYHAYSFHFPVDFNRQQHQQLHDFMLSLGENTLPITIKVLHIVSDDFFIDFPAYGFPCFKISFYKHVNLETQKNYLRLLDLRLLSCITT